MSSKDIGNILLEKEILLESGTNELEILVFNVADYTFGINVAKVREVLPVGLITQLPKAHSSVRGVFQLRDLVVPCVSLVDHLKITTTDENSEQTMILTDFNQQQTAFLVDTIERIHRLSWQEILGVPPLMSFENVPVTAVARNEGRLIVMLDFETIIDEVTDQLFRTEAVGNPHALPREQLRIALADDSPTVRQAITTTLRASGYTQLSIFENGADLWHWIEAQFSESGTHQGVCDLVISDIEMPQMDGLHVTKRIKSHAELRNIPVLLYSSIITPDNRKKGEAVGADAQISKPELDRVVELADNLIVQSQQSGDEGKRPNAMNTDSEAETIGDTTDQSPDASLAATSESPAVESPATEATNVATPAAEVSAEQTPDPTTPALQWPGSSDTPNGFEQAGATTESAATPPPTPNAMPRPVIAEHAAEAVALYHAHAPEGTDPALWVTLVDELGVRVATLRSAFSQAEVGLCDSALLNLVLRTLHTVKSAAMVARRDEISRLTHLVESVVVAVRDEKQEWPAAPLQNYLGWLHQIATDGGDVSAVLAEAALHETELLATLTATAG